MEKINLHIHSNDSLDGTENINTILDDCEEQGIAVASITDHDTCKAYFDLGNTKYTGQLITGLEADAMIGKKTYDILCYGFSLEEVSDWATQQYGTIAFRQQKIFNHLVELCKKKNLSINPETYNAEIEFAHAGIYRMLSESENGKEFLMTYDINSIGDLYRLGTMDETFPLYIDMHLVWPDIKEVKEVIHRNGGKIFLAHPYRYGKENVTDVLDSCVDYVDGIEVWNNPEDSSQVDYLYQYAKQKGLLISAGSDYHGKQHPRHNNLDVSLNKDLEREITNWTKEYKTLKKLPPR